MKYKKEIISIAAGAVMLAVAFFVPAGRYVKLGLYLAAYLAVGWEVLLTAIKNIARGRIFDENFLMMIASVGAFVIGEYPEAIAVMLFYQVGELFQSIAVNRSRKSIAGLMDIRPDSATVLENGERITKDPFDVKKGDLIFITAGERIPLDGTVIEGSANIDTSALTGESVPRAVAVGDSILSGCINTDGTLTVSVEKEYSESTVSKILDLVENASAKKAKSEQFISKFAKYYTPVVVILAVLLGTLPPLLGFGSFSEWIYRGLVFLVVSCPCALVISVPLGYFGGIGRASKHGILVKGGNYLEALAHVDTVVFDKTGTLTKGEFVLKKINTSGDASEAFVLECASHAEIYSTHPIARSILEGYGKDVSESRVTEVKEQAGFGVSCNFDGRALLVGSGRLMEKHGISYEEASDGAAGTTVFVAYGGAYIGSLEISDTLKDNAKQSLDALKKGGIERTYMLTGDKKAIAERVAEGIGIDEVRSGLLPDGKVEELERIMKEKPGKGNTAYVGDGINDAPVLARADVGIAMGALGSDAAIEAADVVIMNDSLSVLPDAIKIAKKTRRIVTENIIFALGVKAVILVLAALGITGMWAAVFADVGVSVIAIMNSVRILYKAKEAL